MFAPIMRIQILYSCEKRSLLHAVIGISERRTYPITFVIKNKPYNLLLRNFVFAVLFDNCGFIYYKHYSLSAIFYFL